MIYCYYMSNSTALYTKYRPQAFAEVVGQEALVSALETATKTKTPAHAYIFSGTRGVGKTTLARIFARELGVSAKDTYELDAASNNSVEDIRDLRESVSTLPFEGEYKVYILDEAHMLSKSAFNALLKTLEEPPAYCIFILATTEPEKLPETIRSRAQLYSLESPSRVDIAKVINKIAREEGYELGTGADDLIATVANGSFRDGISALQKVLASNNNSKTILIDDVERITGAPQGSILNDILSGIINQDTQTSLGAVNTLAVSGVSMSLAMELLIERARAALLLRHGGKSARDILAKQYGKDDIVEIEVLAKTKDGKLGSLTLRELLLAQALMRSATIKQLPLELAIIKLTNKDND
jgi:DNA polymerase-3 subunit gamma/tau